MRKTYEEALRVFQQNNGILRHSHALAKGIDSKTLAEMTQLGYLVRVSKGVYRLPDAPLVGHPDLIDVSLRVPNAVVCLISALAFHDLTTQVPQRVYIALPQKTKAPRIEHPPIDVVYLSPKPYATGVEIHELLGVPVRVYNKEKTIADCFKFRNKIGESVALEALKEYLRQPHPKPAQLIKYAQTDRVAKRVASYLRAML